MMQAPATSIPYNGSGTINIHINNPTASLGGMPCGMMPPPCYPIPYPVYYPYFCYPPNYYLNNTYNNQMIPTQMQAQNQPASPSQPQIPTSIVQNQPSLQAQAASAVAASAAALSNGAKQRQIVVLTDNYVKNLENYLKNPNTELRKSATKELLDRFKEDKSRINNPSLTALLNLALQDTNPTVRALAMTIVSSGYATGNKQTEQILKGHQMSKTNYSADAIQAADSLLKMSQTKVMVPDNSHCTYQNNNNNKKGK